jgi:hypothetical protein
MSRFGNCPGFLDEFTLRPFQMSSTTGHTEDRVSSLHTEAVVHKPKLIAPPSVALALALAIHSLSAATPPPNKNPVQEPAQLVREVVYNELHDHDSHGYWRYWIKRHASKETRVDEQVETVEGPIARTELTNGQPLSADARQSEDSRLQHLLDSSSEQAQHRKEYAEDERRIGRILALLPDAFLYERAELEGDNYHLRFHPNPDYPAHSIESRIFHAMSGDLWISVRAKHLVRLEGKLQENVDFGYGILGRLYKGGWFRLDRTEVRTASGSFDWKTERLEVHMTGRAILFKTIARETSEVRGGFVQVPAGLSLRQAETLIHQQDGNPTSIAAAFQNSSH